MEEFEIIQPSPLLAPFVKQYWFLHAFNGESFSQRIIPTGTVSMTFHRCGQLFSVIQAKQQPRAFISGQSTEYDELLVKGAIDMVSVVFQPHGFNAFFTHPVNRFFQSTVSIKDMSDPDLIELEDGLHLAPDHLSAVRLIESFLLNRLKIGIPYNYKRMDAVVRAVHHGESDIANLAQISCLGYKQFKRVFSEYIGVNPKEFLRVIRFQKALNLLQHHPKMALTRLALECGYYDQLHFNRDFMNFSGFTPKQYLSVYSPYSDYFS